MRRFQIILGQDQYGQMVVHPLMGCARSVDITRQVLDIAGWGKFSYVIQVSKAQPGDTDEQTLNRAVDTEPVEISPEPGSTHVFILGCSLQFN